MASLSTRRSLLLRLQDGGDDEQAAAWEEFVRIYSPEVFRWCRACGLQPSDAADVSQDVLVRFWKQSATFEYDPERRFRSYLRTILTTALSRWSASRKPENKTAALGLEAVLNSAPAREELIQRIEAAYDTELLAVAIKSVKARVKPHTWRAFELVAIEQKSGREASEELGISITLVFMARRNVQKMLKDTVARLEGGSRNDT